MLSTTFAYNPTSRDELILNKVYEKLDEIDLIKADKLYSQFLKLRIKYKNKPQLYYILSEIESYLKNRIDWNNLYEVLSVTDGDTIKIDYNWEETKIRFIWIDTPESYITRFWYKECYWDEASDYLKGLLTWQKVSIEFDITQDRIDKYWRLLVYVFLNWENINEKLIQEGYAFEYTHEKAYKYQKEFKNLEKESKKLKKWLWNEKTCNWERTKVIEIIEDNNKESSNFEWNILKYYDPTNLEYLNMGFSCEKTKYCKYMSSCDEVKYYFYQCNARTFDWDKDGIPCENLCWIEMK